MNTFEIEQCAENFTVGKLIAKGGFSKVYEGFNKRTNEKVSIKVIEIKKNLEKINNEIEILKRIKGKNFLDLIDFTYPIEKCGGFSLIITDFFDGKQLYDIKNYSFNRKIKIFKKIACSILKLHKQDIVHRDIKPANILIDNNDNIKIIDFGSSYIFTENPYRIKTIGTPNYIAPELLFKDTIINDIELLKTDVYSFGVTMFYLFNNQFPFSQKVLIDLYEAKINSKANKSRSGDISLDKLINQCLERESYKRPSMKHICDFFKKMENKIKRDVTFGDISLVTYNDLKVIYPNISMEDLLNCVNNIKLIFNIDDSLINHLLDEIIIDEYPTVEQSPMIESLYNKEPKSILKNQSSNPVKIHSSKKVAFV